MIGLPIIERELQLAQRRRRTYWLRLAAALLAVAVCWTHLDGLSTLQAGLSPGRTLFFLLASIMFAIALLSGLFLTAPCLHEEKQTRMIELLLLTPLRPHHLVLGKMAAYSLQACQMTLAALPVLAAPLALGGVSLSESLRMAALLIVVMLLSLSIGMWSSARWLQTRSAVSGALLLLCAFTVGWTILDDTLVAVFGLAGRDRFLLPGPIQAFYLVSDLNAARAANSFPASLGFTLAVSLAALLLASASLTRLGTERRSNPSKASRPLPIRLFMPRPKDLARRRAGLRSDPAFWLARRRDRSVWQTMAVMTALLGTWIGAWSYYGWSSDSARFCALAGLPILLCGWIKTLTAARAAGGLATMRRNGELELLLVSGLPTHRLERGFRKACWRELLFPGLLLTFVCAGVLFAAENHLASDSRLRVYLVVWLAVVMLAADVFVLAPVGLWQGLIRPNALQAIGGAALMVFVLPWILFLATVWVSPTFFLYGFFLAEPAGWFLGGALWWWVIGFGCNVFFFFHAQVELRDHFRALAADPSRSLWRSLSGWTSFRFRPAFSIALERRPGRARRELHSNLG